MEVLSRITISCFALSYLLAFGLELARFFFRARIRGALSLVILGLGLFAHTSYLVVRARGELVEGVPLASWQAWCLMAAWLLVVATVYLTLRFPSMAYGPFVLPVALGLVVVGYFLGDLPPFSSQGGQSFWRVLHGVSLLLGTVVVCAGFLSGIMYLVHAYRLKKKKAPSRAFRLPSLERLQITSEQSLVISSLLLGLGLVSGIVINLLPQDRDTMAVQWSSPVVWTSGVLLAWLIAALAFQYLYRPARHGQKVAYLVVASFVFLIAELILVLALNHGAQPLESSWNTFSYQEALVQ